MPQVFAVPAFYPTYNAIDFDVLDASAPAGSIIVVSLFAQDTGRPLPNDPLYGPLTAHIQNFQNPAGANGRRIVFGYVDTDFGRGATCAIPPNPPGRANRSLINIKDYIDYWYQVIPALDGIFFDDGPELDRYTGGPPGSTTIAQCIKDLYSQLYQYVSGQLVRSGRPPIAGNAGGSVLLNASQYLEDPGGEWIMSGPDRACDIAILWETEACKYLLDWPVPLPSWWDNPLYKPARVAHTIFDCHDQQEMEQIVAFSKQRVAGYVFVGDQVTANYPALPGYWAAEVSAVTGPGVPPAASLAANYKVYVRDWTTTVTNHDVGQEPSTNLDFISTSDVWNSWQPASSANPFNANDQPISNPVRESAAGSNFAYARVSRNQTDSPVAVSMDFLWADFGLGSNFTYANINPNTIQRNPLYLQFARGESAKWSATGYEWNILAQHSAHLCLAVQVATACDPLINNLNGKAPGPLISQGDPSVLGDNNIAQRNLLVVPTPFPVRFRTSAYAVVHNGELYSRDIELTYEISKTTREAMGDALDQASVIVVNDRHPESSQEERLARHEGGVVLKAMQPAENRWIGLTWSTPQAQQGTLSPVLFLERVRGKIVNGFAISSVPMPIEAVALANIRDHANTCRRLAVTFDLDGAEAQGKAARQIVRRGDISQQMYLSFLRSHIEFMSRSVHHLCDEIANSDPFGIHHAVQQLSRAIEVDDPHHFAGTHSQLLHKLDAFLTMLQKRRGDAADMLQMVRWQVRLYRELEPLRRTDYAAQLLQRSESWISNYRSGSVEIRDYLTLIESLLPIFHRTAAVMKNGELQKKIEMIEEHRKSPDELERAHRDYLLELNTVTAG